MTTISMRTINISATLMFNDTVHAWHNHHDRNPRNSRRRNIVILVLLVVVGSVLCVPFAAFEQQSASGPGSHQRGSVS